MDSTLTLPKLIEETEFHKMLADEKMRNEQHKTNYQILKIEHSRLQDENLRLQNELKMTTEDNTRISESSNKTIAILNKKLTDLSIQSQINKTQSVENIENLKSKIQAEMDQSFRERYSKLEMEADKYRDDFNKLRYDFTFIKSEYEHLKAESDRNIMELKMKYETDVANLQRELQSLVILNSQDSSYETQQLQKLHKDNSYLHAKIKTLLSEIDEHQKTQELSRSQYDDLKKSHVKLLAEKEKSLHILESEKASLLRTKDELSKELSSTRETSTSLATQLTSARQQICTLQNLIEDNSHKSKLNETDLKIETAKKVADVTKERDEMSSVVQELNVEIELLKEKMEKQRKSFVDKERNMEMQMSEMRNEEMIKFTKLEAEISNVEFEKEALEMKCSDLQIRYETAVKSNENNVDMLQMENNRLKNEVESLRLMCETSSQLKMELEEERKNVDDREQQIHRLMREKTELVQIQNELIDQRSTLKDALEKVNRQLQTAKQRENGENQSNHKLMNELKSKLTEAQNNYGTKYMEAERSYEKSCDKLKQELHSVRIKSKQYSKLIMKLRHKIEILQAKNDELEIRKDTLSKYVPHTEHQTVKRQLQEFQRRHNEFRNLLSSEVNAVTNPFTSVNLNQHRPNISNYHNDSTLTDLKKRLENLDHRQKKELRELQELNKESDTLIS